MLWVRIPSQHIGPHPLASLSPLRHRTSLSPLPTPSQNLPLPSPHSVTEPPSPLSPLRHRTSLSPLRHRTSLSPLPTPSQNLPLPSPLSVTEPPSPLSPLRHRTSLSPLRHRTSLSSHTHHTNMLQLVAFPSNLLGFLRSGEWSRCGVLPCFMCLPLFVQLGGITMRLDLGSSPLMLTPRPVSLMFLLKELGPRSLPLSVVVVDTGGCSRDKDQ